MHKVPFLLPFARGVGVAQALCPGLVDWRPADGERDRAKRQTLGATKGAAGNHLMATTRHLIFETETLFADKA
jgi:hypothetical protein